jgi:hypothetical protein
MAHPIVINSSWIQTAYYSSGLFTVRTKKGAEITFADVPLKIWDEFQASPSKGEFINKHVKGKFKEL